MNARTLALLVLLAAGCAAVGPDHQEPRADLPAAFDQARGARIAAGPAEVVGWWRAFEDPLLDALVERATRENLSLQEALSRVREARALRGIEESARYPTLDAELAWLRRGESDNTPFGAFVPDSDLYTARFDASWEVDLFGRVRRSVEAADADLGASVEDARDVLVTLVADTAAAYVELRSFQQRLAIASTNVELQQQTLDLVRTRFDAGLVGERDVAQAGANLETTRARVPELEFGALRAEHRLAVLLGITPGALPPELAALREAAPVPRAPAAVAVGVPADLVRRRPDVRRAERELAAETARVGVLEADLYPRLAIAGSLGLAAEEAGDLFESESGFFGIGPILRWNVFDAGLRRQRVEAQDELAQQAFLRWRASVLRAIEETENALAAFVRQESRRTSLAAAAGETRRAVELARAQYEDGLTDFQAVLDSQRELAALEDDLAQSDASVATNLVAIYKALGGGWQSEDGTEEPSAAAPADPRPQG